jgi:hypothetical protein
MPIGQALQDAKRELSQTHPELLDVLLGWSLMGDPALAKRLREAGLVEAQRYTWPRVRQTWIEVYDAALARTRVEARAA